MLIVSWWRRLLGLDDPAGTTEEAREFGPEHAEIVVWDTTDVGACSDLLRHLGQGLGPARVADAREVPMREQDLNVLLLPLAHDRDVQVHDNLLIELDALIRHRTSACMPLVVGWLVDRGTRSSVWTVEDSDGHLRNVARLTFASAWPSALQRHGAVDVALGHQSAQVSAMVEQLARTVSVMGSEPVLLVSYLEQADVVHVLVSEPLAGAQPVSAWHGFDALVAAVGSRWA